tara:strand:+ start:150 stop:527 length:378 start_codon:yes stop_codon:yes gene_type:complete
MQSNELTFNQIAVSEFIPNIWGTIDTGAYSGVYTDDVQVCYKLSVWSLQCKFAKLVTDYVNHLTYGIPQPCKLEDLTTFKYGLQVLNDYNPRDIPAVAGEKGTVLYNSITYTTILKILKTLNNKY